MKKRFTALGLALLWAVVFCAAAFATDIPRQETPQYKVAFYAFDCYQMQNQDGTRSGYGYEMMQDIAKYMQCTFDFVGYDKTPAECEDMLRSGELDIYTAAKITPEREQEFAISKHPAITSETCMNVKVDNDKIVAGDYSTYDGIRIGLLERHIYNDRFLAFADEKGFSYEIVYYQTPTELTQALIDGEVDALVNSYIGTPVDERTVENFGETPYYIMSRKEDQALIDKIDAAIDRMNIETPTWRTDLFNRYYGEQQQNTTLTSAEEALLQQLQEQGAVIRAVLNPDNGPYAWMQDGEPQGIVLDIFKTAAQQLGLAYEFIPVQSRAEYRDTIAQGTADIWVDISGDYEDTNVSDYKLTDTYLTTTVSLLRERGAYGKVQTLAVPDITLPVREIIETNWPDVEIVSGDNTENCTRLLANGEVDAVLLMSYTAQRLAQADVQNRFRADIVPGAMLELKMGVNAQDARDFYGLWSKTLANVADGMQAETVQSYVEVMATPSVLASLFDHPILLLAVCMLGLALVFAVFMYGQSVRSSRRQKQISDKLAVALEDAKKANEAKQDFFSKMSHDIRTPLNVVLGMTQVALKYKNDTNLLESALDNIASEGNYLLVLINSILDVNQLEHGTVELQEEPFEVTACLQNSIMILRPMVEKREQHLVVTCPQEPRVVVGDSERLSQIMINIISNAIKYTPAGGNIRVSLEYLPSSRCRFICIDNGLGMTQEFVDHITEEFARAEDSRVSKIQGAGLGMSVVKGFTDLMHGTLNVQSEPGRGSTFAVEIPFKEATEEQRRKALTPAEDPTEKARRYKGKKVLLAEDNALNAEISTELLQTIGLKVDWVENGKLAVDAFDASELNEYYCVFMDMQMPVMDGVEATRQIRASTRADHTIPIFAMTANTFTADRQRCFEAGMSGYIAKPISLKEITNTLQEKA